MFNHGKLWLNYDGCVIDVNYQSGKEKKNKKRLIEINKNLIKNSIRKHLQPNLLLETKKFRI